MPTKRSIFRFIPIATWLSECSPRADIVAGIAVAGLLVPEGMAYAGIAGVPAQMGLHAAMVGMFVYAIFGTSPNGLLFFGNANHVRRELREQVKQAGKPLRAVVINLEACPETDVTSLEMLKELRNELHESGTDLCYARVADPVRDLFRRSGFLERLGEGRIFPRVELAVDAFLETNPLPALALSLLSAFL